MIIGIDQGTTGTLGILMDREGNLRETSARTHRQIHPQAGWVEHDPLEIWEQVASILKELAGKAATLGSRIEGVGLANQGETLVAWNRRTSEPIGNAIVWQDTRTQAWIDELAADDEVSGYVADTTGLHLDSYFSAGKMRWILENVPMARALRDAGDLCVGTLDAWMMWNGTGGREFVTDASTAARTQLMRLSDLEYDPRLLELFGIPVSCLPAIVSCDCPVALSGLGPELDGVPIAASLVDQPAAVFGHACLEPGQSKATYGTGCFVYVNAGDRPPAAGEGLLSTLAWAREAGRVYALDGGVIAVASIMTWLRDQLGMLNDPREIDGLLAGHEPDDKVACVTAHAGLGSPIWDRSARAAWLGMGLATDRRDLVYAVLEGIAFRVAQVIDAMDRAAGARIRALRVDGGLSRCRTLMQLQADMLGRPVEVVADAEATALGIACFAARSLGMWSDDQEVVRRVRVEEVFRPEWTGDRRGARMKRLLEAQQLARAW